MKNELEKIQKKILKGEERDVSSIELLGYILGTSSSEDSSVALAMDLLSHLGGWDALFNAKRAELESFQGLAKNQIDLILAIGNLQRKLETTES